MSKLLIFCWFFSVLLGVATEVMHSLPQELSIVLPAIYLSLSFYVFRNLPFAYRIFHLACIIPLAIYFVLGLVTQLPKIFASTGVVEEFIAYAWFGSMSTTYLFFLVMLGVTYLPYCLIKKYQASKNSELADSSQD